jgi:hypothetical protein
VTESWTSGFRLRQFIVFLPWNGFENKYIKNSTKHLSYLYPKDQEKELEILLHYFPHLINRSKGALKLLCRNINQILGENLDTLSHEIICWTPNGEFVGGTRIAMLVGNDKGIPVHNLYFEETQRDILEKYDIK